MPTYDLFVYHDFTDTVNENLRLGEDAGRKLGDTFGGLTVVALGPPIHGSKDATVVLAHGARPMADVQALLDRRDG